MGGGGGRDHSIFVVNSNMSLIIGRDVNKAFKSNIEMNPQEPF